MEAYRDQYATLFNNGNGVVVLGISMDADTTLASWARDAKFPMTFVSDSGAVIAKKYKLTADSTKPYARIVYVIAPDGKITYETRFSVMAADAYAQLGEEVKKAMKR